MSHWSFNTSHTSGYLELSENPPKLSIHTEGGGDTQVCFDTSQDFAPYGKVFDMPLESSSPDGGMNFALPPELITYLDAGYSFIPYLLYTTGPNYRKVHKHIPTNLFCSYYKNDGFLQYYKVQYGGNVPTSGNYAAIRHKFYASSTHTSPNFSDVSDGRYSPGVTDKCLVIADLLYPHNNDISLVFCVINTSWNSVQGDYTFHPADSFYQYPASRELKLDSTGVSINGLNFQDTNPLVFSWISLQESQAVLDKYNTVSNYLNLYDDFMTLNTSMSKMTQDSPSDDSYDGTRTYGDTYPVPYSRECWMSSEIYPNLATTNIYNAGYAGSEDFITPGDYTIVPCVQVLNSYGRFGNAPTDFIFGRYSTNVHNAKYSEILSMGRVLEAFGSEYYCPNLRSDIVIPSLDSQETIYWDDLSQEQKTNIVGYTPYGTHKFASTIYTGAGFIDPPSTANSPGFCLVSTKLNSNIFDTTFDTPSNSILVPICPASVGKGFGYSLVELRFSSRFLSGPLGGMLIWRTTHYELDLIVSTRRSDLRPEIILKYNIYQKDDNGNVTTSYSGGSENGSIKLFDYINIQYYR